MSLGGSKERKWAMRRKRCRVSRGWGRDRDMGEEEKMSAKKDSGAIIESRKRGKAARYA